MHKPAAGITQDQGYSAHKNNAGIGTRALPLVLTRIMAIASWCYVVHLASRAGSLRNRSVRRIRIGAGLAYIKVLDNEASHVRRATASADAHPPPVRRWLESVLSTFGPTVDQAIGE
jgi:hypothetical protein